MIRTTEQVVTFFNTFCFSCLDEQLPAGDYKIQTDEELIQGLSFVSFRRIDTIIYLRGKHGMPEETRSLSIDPDELNALLKKDTQRSNAQRYY